MKKKALYILVVFAAIIVACVFIFKSDPVPENIIEQFETDSSEDSTENKMVDDKIDELTNDPDFDF